MTPAAEAEFHSPGPPERRARRVWLWVGIATAALALSFIGFSAVMLYWPAGPERASIQAYRASPDDAAVEVEYVSGRSCEDTLWERALESETEVVIDVAFRGYKPGENSLAIAYVCQVTIPLDAPLGDRIVTDPNGERVSDTFHELVF